MRERTPFPRDLITRLPNLRLLLTTGVRNAGLDLPAFKDQGVPVAGTKGGGQSTQQHCVAMILALARNLIADDQSVKTGGWQTGITLPLAGRTFGALGLGRLGLAVGRIMHVAFDMQVIAWSPNLTQARADEQARSVGLPAGTFRAVGREALFREADVLSVHVVLSERSRGLVTAADLRLLKPDALFVNTSRGPVVVDKDLRAVLDQGRIRGAALDVFELEPLPADSPWRTTEWGAGGRSQVLLTPHTGYAERETLTKWYREQVENIVRWQNGEPLANPMG